MKRIIYHLIIAITFIVFQCKSDSADIELSNRYQLKLNKITKTGW